MRSLSTAQPSDRAMEQTCRERKPAYNTIQKNDEIEPWRPKGLVP